MEVVSIGVILAYASITLLSLGIIAYLVVKRIKSKGQEGFEYRDN